MFPQPFEPSSSRKNVYSKYVYTKYFFPVDETIDLSQPIKFDGRTYHKYPNRVGFREKAQVNNKIEVRLKTKESDGLILLIHKPSTLQVKT